MTPEARHSLTVALSERSYPICIGARLMGDAAEFALAHGTRVALVTNETLWPLFGQSLSNTLVNAGCDVLPVVLPDGEAFKDWATLNLIFDTLLKHRADRKTTLVALGGGVIGDITGFAAATYQRGIPFIQVPTTLLAQVDSSVGGKTAINHPLGKNMIGAFYQPQRVICDINTLRTLPAREVAAGLAEVIKYGPIADEAFLCWLESHIEDLLALDASALNHAIRQSCLIKARVVGLDEREQGLRAILNFGHTFGHAIEAGLGFGEWLHGEAVGAGMVMAADLSERLGLMPAGFGERLTGLIARAGLPTQGPSLGVENYLHHMQVDKKSVDGDIRFVLIDGPGSACLRAAPLAAVRATLEAHTA